MFPVVEKHYRENRSKHVKKLTFRAGSEEAAEDIVQEAYYRAMKYYASFREGENFSKWFSTILSNCLREYKNIETYHSSEEFEENEADPVAGVQYSQHVMRDVHKLIEGRSKMHRDILNLHFRQEYSAIDISRITEYSYANCHQVIQRFRNELKELFKD